MPVTMGGMASGLNTDQIVDQLVQVEAKPIFKWENEKKTFKARKNALQQLQKILKDLDSSTQELYGFRAVYDAKKVLSSDETVVTATADRFAKIGDSSLKVKAVATTHQIVTDKHDESEKFPAGKIKFEVDGEEVEYKFPGGSLKFFKERFDENCKDLASSAYIKTYGKNHVITFSSKVSGKKGEILISGDKKLLKKIGLVSGPKSDGKDSFNVVYDKRYFTSYTGSENKGNNKGKISVLDEGKSVELKGNLWQNYVLPFEVNIKEDTILEFDFFYEEQKEEEKEAIPYRVEIGPEEKITVKGIQLEGYNVYRLRELEEKKIEIKYDDKLGIGVYFKNKDGIINRKFYTIDEKSKARQQLMIGNDLKDKSISKIVLYCNEGKAIFKNMDISTPQANKNYLQAKNEIKKATDAKIEYNGIEVIRDKNEGINDVIKGISLSLVRASDDNVILTVQPDVDKAISKIKKFVGAYNKYLDFTEQLTKAAKSEKAGDYKKNKNKNGLFVGDMTVLTLENTLKKNVSNAYPGISDIPINLFTQMGVSTGKINGGWQSNKKAKLQIDEEKLKTTIVENPDGVKEFFGVDTDGDNKVDNGMGFTMHNTLRLYVRPGNNIISSKMKLEDEKIKNRDEQIAKKEEHLKSYEKKLKAKFGNMEKAMSSAKSQRNWMNSQTGGGGSSEK